jgi:YbbR domain-containing protein
LPDDYQLSSVEINPKTVEIQGTIADIDRIENIATSEISLEGRRDDANFPVRLRVPAAVKSGAEQATVTLKITKTGM